MVKRSVIAEVEPARRLPKVWQTVRGPHKRFPLDFLDPTDPSVRERVLLALTSDISSVLAEAVDELCTYSTEFRTGLQRAVLYVLQRALKRPDPVLFFNEAIPGFTVMLFKKQDIPASWVVLADWAEEPEPPCDTPEAAAAAEVIRQFVQRTGHRVLVVEGDDVICVFFPVSDLKKNLKDMGFYHTE